MNTVLPLLQHSGYALHPGQFRICCITGNLWQGFCSLKTAGGILQKTFISVTSFTPLIDQALEEHVAHSMNRTLEHIVPLLMLSRSCLRLWVQDMPPHLFPSLVGFSLTDMNCRSCVLCQYADQGNLDSAFKKAHIVRKGNQLPFVQAYPILKQKICAVAFLIVNSFIRSKKHWGSRNVVAQCM